MAQLRSSKVAVQIAHKIELSILRVNFTNKRFKISKDLNWRVRRPIPGYHEKRLWSRFSDFYTKIFELDDVVFVTCGIVDVWSWGVVESVDTRGLGGSQKEFVSSTWQLPASIVRPDMPACLLYRESSENRIVSRQSVVYFEDCRGWLSW